MFANMLLQVYTKSTLSGFIVKSGLKQTIQLAVDSANQSLTKKLCYQDAECPILERIMDPRLRCAVAVVLGSDTFPGGICGVGPSKIAQILDSLGPEEASEQLLFQKAIELRQGIDKYDMVDLSIATDAIFYEPSQALEDEPNKENPGHQ
jgi:hypothetical protein